jgi:hypothetical protein
MYLFLGGPFIVRKRKCLCASKGTTKTFLSKFCNPCPIDESESVIPQSYCLRGLRRKNRKGKRWDFLHFCDNWPHLLLVASETCHKISIMLANLACQHIGTSEGETYTTPGWPCCVACITDQNKASVEQAWDLDQDNLTGVKVPRVHHLLDNQIALPSDILIVLCKEFLERIISLDRGLAEQLRE